MFRVGNLAGAHLNKDKKNKCYCNWEEFLVTYSVFYVLKLKSGRVR
jgi:hypothetical protein